MWDREQCSAQLSSFLRWSVSVSRTRTLWPADTSWHKLTQATNLGRDRDDKWVKSVNFHHICLSRQEIKPVKWIKSGVLPSSDLLISESTQLGHSSVILTEHSTLSGLLLKESENWMFQTTIVPTVAQCLQIHMVRPTKKSLPNALHCFWNAGDTHFGNK